MSATSGDEIINQFRALWPSSLPHVTLEVREKVTRRKTLVGPHSLKLNEVAECVRVCDIVVSRVGFLDGTRCVMLGYVVHCVRKDVTDAASINWSRLGPHASQDLFSACQAVAGFAR